MHNPAVTNVPERGAAGAAERLWKPADVVAFLCGTYTEKTLANWRARKIGPPYIKTGPAAVFYRPEAVKEWARKREQSTSAVGEVA